MESSLAALDALRVRSERVASIRFNSSPPRPVAARDATDAERRLYLEYLADQAGAGGGESIGGAGAGAGSGGGSADADAREDEAERALSKLDELVAAHGEAALDEDDGVVGESRLLRARLAGVTSALRVLQGKISALEGTEREAAVARAEKKGSTAALQAAAEKEAQLKVMSATQQSLEASLNELRGQLRDSKAAQEQRGKRAARIAAARRRAEHARNRAAAVTTELDAVQERLDDARAAVSALRAATPGKAPRVPDDDDDESGAAAPTATPPPSSAKRRRRSTGTPSVSQLLKQESKLEADIERLQQQLADQKAAKDAIRTDDAGAQQQLAGVEKMKRDAAAATEEARATQRQTELLKECVAHIVGAKAATGDPFATVIQLLQQAGGEMQMGDLKEQASGRVTGGRQAVMSSVYSLLGKQLVIVDRSSGEAVVGLQLL